MIDTYHGEDPLMALPFVCGDGCIGIIEEGFFVELPWSVWGHWRG